MQSFQIVLAAVHLLNSSVTFWGIVFLILSRQKKEFWYIQKKPFNAFPCNNLPSQYTHLWSLTLLMRRDRQIFGLKSLSLPLFERTFFGLDLWFFLLCLSSRHSHCFLGLSAARLLWVCWSAGRHKQQHQNPRAVSIPSCWPAELLSSLGLTHGGLPPASVPIGGCRRACWVPWLSS